MNSGSSHARAPQGREVPANVGGSRVEEEEEAEEEMGSGMFMLMSGTGSTRIMVGAMLACWSCRSSSNRLVSGVAQMAVEGQ